MDDLKIFAIYLNIDNISKQRVDEMVYDYYSFLHKEYNNLYPNIKCHIFPVHNQDTKIECVYLPSHTDKKESDLIRIYKLFLQEKNGEAIEKMKILERKLKVNKIINKDEH